MNIVQSPPKYFHTFDIIRGIAAVVVILNHWEFFYFEKSTWVKEGIDKTTLPFYTYLSAIYNHGVIAVDLFFLLSGFIFFWLYAERIAKGKMNFGKFMVFRISRLYPIHLVTLLSVAVLQWLMIKNTGHYFIVLFNDSYHFILNLLFMQSWGIEKGASFNGPSWSASVEAFLYLLFFFICYVRMQHNKWLLLLLMPVGIFIQYYYSLIGKGMYSFFLGALVYYIYTWMLKENRNKKYLSSLIVFTILLWGILFAEYYFGYLRDIFMKQYLHLFPHKTPASAEIALGLVKNFIFRTLVSPCTILALALWETNKGGISKKWAAVGNCSYAMYMVHFSLQIAFVLIANTFHIDNHVFRSPITVLVFFLILVPLSLILYYYFEFPAQEKIRQKFFRTSSRDVNVAQVEVKT
ncbi:acyltransferase family protein [Pedobacter sp. UBA5917]|jgi:peptidoglycan/LPS O-acetylase OafA/YrhL|uniref:acyltransferase family protein n=1 Tax=Pedobacter sp. UBA5917 TaxID=1947061 RepID=UPI0025F550F9|nr:acyltransferase [Pedobacter sp. UBA5917]